MSALSPTISQVLQASVPQELTFSLDGRTILVISRDGTVTKGASYEANPEEMFADLQRCIQACLAAHIARAEDAERELGRLKHLMH